MDAIQATQQVWTVFSNEAPRVFMDLPPILQILLAIGVIVGLQRTASGKAFLG